MLGVAPTRYTHTMASFTVGEEVLFDDLRYVISQITDEDPPRYRLLATTKEGAKVVWRRKQDIQKIKQYTQAKDDTENYF